MRLRQELSLFFGGLLVLMLSLVVGVSYSSLRDTLEQGFRRQFSVEPFLQILDAESQLLAERARILEGHRVTRRFIRDIADDFRFKEREAITARLSAARSGASEEAILEGKLFSLYDRVLEAFKDVPPHDLVGVYGPKGSTLVELLGGVTGEDFLEDDFSIGAKLDSMQEHPFWEWTVDLGKTRGCFVFPDGKFYLYGAYRLNKGQADSRREMEALTVVGTEISPDFLRRTAGQVSAFISYDGKVVGTDEKVEHWGKLLIDSVEEAIPEVWTSPEGKTFLIKSASLPSFYGDSSSRPTEVGRIFFVQDYAEVENAVYAQARQTLLIGFVALVSALLLVPLVARRFTGPIGTLSTAMKGVGEDKLHQIPESEISSILEVKEASLSFNEMIIGLRQKKALEAFVPEGTRQEVEESQGQMPSLGGQRLERTIMFSDLRGFTAMSERLPADQVMEIINIYLHSMSREIREEGGDINEYIGDAILAVFAEPDAAVRAARNMNEALIELHEEATTEELKGLSQGIGLHTGFIVEGNIGEAGTRLKRAVVGDTVNLAARIQDRSRDGKFTCIFLSGDTKEKLKDEYELDFFGDEDFKGKAEPVPVWEVRS